MTRTARILCASICLSSCTAFQATRTEPRPGNTVAAADVRQKAGQIPPAGTVLSYSSTVDRVAPAVVTVHAARRVRAPEQFQFQNDPFFERFFGGRTPRGGQRQTPGQQERALGSGVIVRADGYILTNFHVVDGSEDISVVLIDRREFKAKLVGGDKPSDLAVLKVDATQLPLLELGNSDQVKVGDICLAVGNPLGIGETVTAGIISAKGRFTGISDGSFEDFLQTDAPINHGNSGGALVNTRGELIGINSQIVSPGGGGNIGIGFAIPSNMAKNVMTQLISHGKVSRGQLGITAQYISTDLAAGLGLKSQEGVLVSNVTPGSPAEKAGVKAGDVILAINGSPVNEVNALRNMVASAGSGNEVTLTTLRNNQRQQVRVKLEAFNDPSAAPAGSEGGSSQPSAGRLGVQVAPLTPEIASQLDIPRGTTGLAVASVDPAGAAATAGIREGDVIQSVNRQPVKSTADLQAALKQSADRPVLLQVMRGDRSIFVAVRLK